MTRQPAAGRASSGVSARRRPRGDDTAQPRRRRVSDGPGTETSAWPDQRGFRFHAIDNARAHEEVLDQLCFAIRSRVYGVGDNLPNSDALAVAMGVSRPTVGDAVRELVQRGILRAVRGAAGGLVVLSNDIPLDLLSAQSSAWRRVARRELVEARRPVEMEIGALAAARATDGDLARLVACVVEMARAREADDLLAFVNADHSFHYVLGRAAGNSVLADVQHQILAELALLIDSAKDEFAQAEHVIALHTKLINAIRRRQHAAVSRAMNALIELVVEEEPDSATSSVRRARDGGATARQPARAATPSPRGRRARSSAR